MLPFKHLWPVSAGVTHEDHISVAGHDLVDLTRSFGTPLYVYDAATLRHQVTTLRDQLSACYQGEYEITYAAKAYFSLAMARHLAELGVGVDVVSQGELAVARKAGFSPQRIHVHGNNKTQAELDLALELGAQAIVVDSLEELHYLADMAHARQQRARIWLRVSPGVSVDTHAAVQTAHHATKFGLPIVDGQAAEAICFAQEHPALNLTGLHTHLGSNFFDAAGYRQAIAALMALAEENDFIPTEISPGGGWGVPYLPEQPLNGPRAWIETVTSSLHEECTRRGWPLPRLVVEPGRWLVARAGVALYTVGTSKHSGDGTHYVAVDGGMADNPRPALYESHYTALLANRVSVPALENCSVAGRFCESGDVLISQVMLPETARGDLLAMPAAGAYQLSMSSNYNLTGRPAVLWLAENQVEVMQRREVIEESGWWVGE